MNVLKLISVAHNACIYIKIISYKFFKDFIDFKKGHKD